MNYCIVKDGVISNIIVCVDDRTAESFNALPSYEGAAIGKEYFPPAPETKPTAEELIDIMLGVNRYE